VRYKEKNSDNLEELYINGQSIFETVNILAKSKTKDHQSLSNKTIFNSLNIGYKDTFN
jgi:hypothetical protein